MIAIEFVKGHKAAKKGEKFLIKGREFIPLFKEGKVKRIPKTEKIKTIYDPNKKPKEEK